MTTEIMALVLVISGLMVGLVAAGIVGSVIIGVIWHFFPNCKLIKWIKAEVFQEEDLAKYSDVRVGDCLRARMNK